MTICPDVYPRGIGIDDGKTFNGGVTFFFEFGVRLGWKLRNSLHNYCQCSLMKSPDLDEGYT